MALQIRRGPNAQRATTLLQTGEVAWTTDTKKLYVGDGVTTGGVNILANIAGTGFVWNPSTEQLDLAGSTITGINADNVAETNGVVPRLWYRSSLGKTHASEIFTTVAGAAHSGISFSWDDVNQKLSATVLTENAADAAAALFTSGTHTGISFNYGLTQDAANRIDATVSSEYIQDTVNDLFTAGVHTGITFSYSDSLNSLSAAVNMGGNLASNLGMNAKDITGTGNINITGTVAASLGLGANLPLNSYNINGTGNINITGSVSSTTATIGSLSLSAASVSMSSNTLLINSTNPNGITINSLTSGLPNGASISGLLIQGQKGTLAAPTNTGPGDYVTRVNMAGYYGGAYKNIANITGQWALDAVMTDAYPKSSLLVSIGSGTASYYAGFTGPGVWFAPILISGAYATSTAYPATTASSAGAIIYDSTTKHIVGYNGSSWKQLDNWGTSSYALTIASAATIVPTAEITFVSGVVQINNITPPSMMAIGGGASFNATIAGTTLTVTSVPTGTISVGSVISGAGVSPGTIITANIAGSGNGSTWTVNISQTIAVAVAITAVGNSGGQITLIPTDLWSTGTSGNIALATTAVVSRALIMTYDHNTTKWYPSY